METALVKCELITMIAGIMKLTGLPKYLIVCFLPVTDITVDCECVTAYMQCQAAYMFPNATSQSSRRPTFLLRLVKQ